MQDNGGSTDPQQGGAPLPLPPPASLKAMPVLPPKPSAAPIRQPAGPQPQPHQHPLLPAAGSPQLAPRQPPTTPTLTPTPPRLPPSALLRVVKGKRSRRNSGGLSKADSKGETSSPRSCSCDVEARSGDDSAGRSKRQRTARDRTPLGPQRSWGRRGFVSASAEGASDSDTAVAQTCIKRADSMDSIGGAGRAPSRGRGRGRGAGKARGQREKGRQELSDEEFEEGLRASFSEDEEVPPELVKFSTIERFLAWRWAAPASDTELLQSTVRTREYYVKWKALSYLHCSWLKRADLDAAAKFFPGLKQRIRMFEQKKLPEATEAPQDSDLDDDEAEREGQPALRRGPPLGVEPGWTTVERVIDSRVLKDGRTEYMIKWEGLGYDEATWEILEDLKGPEVEAAMVRFKGLKSISRAADGHRRSYQEAPPRKRVMMEIKDSVRQYSETPPFLAGGKLHPYQLEGLNWLLFAWRQHKHVILADEMGLGKTVQAVSYITSLREEFFVRRPQLVIVPLSTLPNWERELRTWAPQLNVVSFIGNAAARAVIKRHEFYVPAELGADTESKPNSHASLAGRVRFDVLLTTYEMMLSEESALNSLDWETMLIDEGHRLKNKASRLFQVLHHFKTRQRTLLTGTPLQNSLDELFMLMHFLEPEKFSSLEDFQAQFSEITAEEQMARLHTLLKPHLLRRLKKDVLKQMPPKKEQLVRVELSNVQKEYYKSVLTRSYPVLVGSKAAGGQVQTKLKNVVMELRKCCNHPYLFEGAERDTQDKGEAHRQLTAASGKLQLLARMLPRLRAAGHRVLIYSQFARMLDILEDWLAGAGWGEYCRIDGSVSSADRQMRIDQFNKEQDRYFCFLLSTRAGGLGINLATADTVIIYDSDWNPHNDLQAQARAHRLGQQKAVMIYRLVTRATIEERMMQQSKKKMVLEHMVVHKMSKMKDGGDLKQTELSDIIRYGAKELFCDGAAGGGAPSNAAAVGSNPAGEEQKGAVESGGRSGEGPQKKGAEDERVDRVKSTIAQEEEAGRTGGQVGKGIVYSDEDIDHLLDRSDLCKQQADQEPAGSKDGGEDDDEEYLKAFKVADFGAMGETLDEKVVEELNKKGLPGEEMDLDANRDYWDGLIKDKYVDLQDEEMAAMGKGRRARREINYNEAFKSARNSEAVNNSDVEALDEDDMTANPSGGRRTKRSGSMYQASAAAAAAVAAAAERDAARKAAARREGSSGPAAEAHVPLVEGEGEGLRVVGFSGRERLRFASLLMRFGLGEKKPDGSFDWKHILHKFPSKEPSIVTRYGQVVLQHLCAPLGPPPSHLHGVSREAVLIGHSKHDVLERLALLRLIGRKMTACKEEPAEDFSVGREETDMPVTFLWHKSNDKALLRGILRHGHGRWREILHDEALELKEVVLAEMGAEVQAAAKSKAEAKEGGLVRRSESPPDEENGRNGPCKEAADEGADAVADVTVKRDTEMPDASVREEAAGEAAGKRKSQPRTDKATGEVEDRAGRRHKAAGANTEEGGEAKSRSRVPQAGKGGRRDRSAFESDAAKKSHPAEEWLRRRAESLADALRGEYCAEAAERPKPKPDPRFQYSRGYTYAAIHAPPPPPWMVEAARRSTRRVGTYAGSRMWSDSRGMFQGGLKGVPLESSLLALKKERQETIHTVVAAYNILCQSASQVRADAARAMKPSVSGDGDDPLDSGNLFRQQLKKMEKMCNVLLSTLKADKDRKAAARKAEKEKSEAMRLEELARREAQAQQAQAKRETERMQRILKHSQSAELLSVPKHLTPQQLQNLSSRLPPQAHLLDPAAVLMASRGRGAGFFTEPWAAAAGGVERPPQPSFGLLGAEQQLRHLATPGAQPCKGNSTSGVIALNDSD